VRNPFAASAPVDWLVVGLGNPGDQYARTPHNVGFLVADRLAERWELPKPKTRYAGLLTEGRIPGRGAPPPAAIDQPLRGRCPPPPAPPAPGGPRVALLWPQTYMNDAGRSVGPARGAFKLDLDRVLVLHDEIDLPFGEIRSRIGGGLAGHNGLKSLRQGLGSPDFARVRIGVGRPDSTDPEIVAAHVLGRWRQSSGEVAEVVDRAADIATSIVLGELSL
jgi:peptidyl-tRNA hydrolase, PTH1 family